MNQTLDRCEISFHTNDDDKDGDTNVAIAVICDGGNSVAAASGTYGHWNDNSDHSVGLQVILGHWGEVVLFYAERLAALDRVSALEQPIATYLRRNLYITDAGPVRFSRASGLGGPPGAESGAGRRRMGHGDSR